jgi:hypothetical protein
MTLTLRVKELSITEDHQRITLETPRERAEVIAGRVAAIKGGEKPQVNPAIALVLPLADALDVQPGTILTVTIS